MNTVKCAEMKLLGCQEPSVDHIAVLMSGGLLATGELPSDVVKRCDYILENKDDFDLIVASSSFSLNVRPKLDADGRIRSEASAGCSYLKEQGFTKEVLCEQFSHDTVGSVFFVLSVYAKIFNAKKVTFVTSDFHCKRVEVISSKLNQILSNTSTKVEVVGCPATGANAERVRREFESTVRFIKTYESICEESKFLKKMLREHANYNCNYSGSNLDEKDLAY